MKRSGNIGAAKNMDSVFADFTDDELALDLIFDEDDQLIEIVEGYTEEGNTVFEEDEEIFKIAHQVAEENDAKPEEVLKNTEKLLGPDNDTDQNIKDIEDVKKEELDDSQTIDNLKKNGESEADKELGLDKLEKEYHSSATVEEAYMKWLNEDAYDYDAENEAEGTDDKFGKEIDNSLPEEDPKIEEDEKYNDTNDATVKEAVESWFEAYDYDAENEAEGTDDKFGKEVDNTEVKPDEVAPTGDEEYNATNDATVDEAFVKWLNESDEVCDCGKADCPICSKKVDDGRHEESEHETITDGDGEGTPDDKGLDDNTLPTPDEMTPDCSPETDNGDITDDGCEEAEKLEEAFKAWLEEGDVELPMNDGETPMTPEDDAETHEELEDIAPKSDEGIEEAMMLEFANAGVYSITEAKFNFLPKFKKDPALAKLQNEAKEAEMILNNKGENDENTVKRCFQLALRILDVIVNIDSVFTTLPAFLIVGLPIHLALRGVSLALNYGQEFFAREQATKCIQKLVNLKDKVKDSEEKEKIQKQIDKLNEKIKDLEAKDVNETAQLHEEDEQPAAEGTQNDMPEQDATTSEDECGSAKVPTSNGTPTAEMEAAFEAWLHEEDEVEAKEEEKEEEVVTPDAEDIKAAAETEAEDTESEFDDDLAAVMDDSDGEAETNLEYDPSDEDLLDLAAGVDESAK